jgi:hypothetical protein
MSKEREMMAGFEWKWKNSADGYVAFVSSRARVAGSPAWKVTDISG